MSPFSRLRSKLYRIRRLSLEWVRLGGDPHDIVQALLLFHEHLEKHQVRASERVLDKLILRLQRGASAGTSDHASAA
jgi:hypothetical protein